MSDEERPDSDALLAVIQKEEAKQQRGKLKIFFGMAAGVGKTYAMLDAAHQKRAEGIDVVVGYVETHKRSETEAMLEGFEIIPRLKLDYRGTTVEEMDLDAILKRKPGLVLIDELAHSNAPGTRHIKRYQDVLEILDDGIDVYTTVNVQHFESRADAVRQITGVMIRETVPDTILDIADEIKLIDIAPDDLIKRLSEGKVYVPERAESAAQNFFRKGNLTALREMALRLTAERVDHQLQDYMEAKGIPGPWHAGARLMVAVSPSPLSERLVRWTRRMAYTLEAPWIAVNIESNKQLSDDDKKQLMENLTLARELGAEIITTAGQEIVTTLMRVAHQHNVTQIVVGKPARPSIQEMLQGGSLVSRLIRISGNIDIYVVRGVESESKERSLISYPTVGINSGPNQYLLAACVVILAILINGLLVNAQILNYQEVALIMLVVVLLLGNFIGRGPILLAAFLSAVMWDYLFIPPTLTLIIGSVQDVLMFGIFFVSALITGNLTARLKSHERRVRWREQRTEAMYRLAREVSRATTMNDVLKTAVEQMGDVFEAKVAIILPDGAGKLSREAHQSSTFQIDDKEFSVAAWAFDNAKPAGHFTETLTMAQAQYIPLCPPSGVVGVIGILRAERLSIDQDMLLQTFISQIGLAIEREMLDDAARRAAVLEESERLYSTVLDSISHELRTPLAAIAGATSGLLDPSIHVDDSKRQELNENIQEATERLNRLVDNLLDMTRIESGRMKLNLEWCDVTELIDVSLKQQEKNLATHDLIVEIEPDLPFIRVDFVLIEQVIVNLLHNAANYTPPDVRIRVTAKIDKPDLLIIVADRGPGIPPDVLGRVFEKFYRVPGSAAGGTGLGLSICRALIEAHGGTLIAENRAHGGARFTIRLPLQEQPPAPPLEPELASFKL